jgi:diguanylate cyclase (GGDEF)-like protein/putative nucleotidyltransferase with HDIG domain
MIVLAALAGSVYMLLPLLLALTSPDFLMGGRGETEAIFLFIPCLALFAAIIPLHRFRHQTTPKKSVCDMGAWNLLGIPLVLTAGVWALLAMLRGYTDSVALAVMSAPSMLLGAWAWAMWWRNQYLQARLKEVSELYRHRDAITGLLNHYAVYEALKQQIREASRSKHPLSLIRLDLDRFALFNATHGHGSGDNLLRQVAQIVNASLPPGAVLGRYDADEFLIILPHTTRSQAVTIARHLRERIHHEAVVHSEGGQVIPVAVSSGVAEFPSDATSAQELLSMAERALLAARQNGSGIADSQSSWRTRYQIEVNGAFSTLEAMIIAIDNKDHYTRRHSEEASEYALWIAEELGLSEEQKHVLRLGGLLHDVGKVGIPDEVLMKPGLLTAEEYEVMKQHTLLGAVMLSALPGLEKISPLARSHHERWDGAGYPDGLAGEEIPLLARILTVADAFSAMTTDRPYRKGMDWPSALTELKRQKGKQFDPAVVDAFVAAVYRRANRESLKQDSLPMAA